MKPSNYNENGETRFNLDDEVHLHESELAPLQRGTDEPVAADTPKGIAEYRADVENITRVPTELQIIKSASDLSVHNRTAEVILRNAA